ncbi:response regulator transcription factor [Thermodesulfovibrio yellowstonii]|uniref:response regulator transcription factor n=1 Tax=Thermodesulfovibrio yellowstonii TaxID=28262 RepID=UPI0024B38873|nr:response regulator transcription factor [Thermodesulfovibrio yellowstonii]MDI6865214.1 response regulator transcription factor [Thermodesulfovibrio yellowstonii]
MDDISLLVVDDDPDILRILKANFEFHGFTVITTENWEKGKNFINQVNLLILDIMLPDADGFEILKEIRQKNLALPVIMLTAKDKISDRVLGLEIGADDYVIKPFETLELIARVKACLRRTASVSINQIKIGDLFIDFKKRVVKKKDNEIILTPKEYDLLCYLISKKGEVVSKKELKKFLWSKEEKIYPWSRVIDVHIMHLRKKIEDNPTEPKYIITVTGIGYKFTDF